MSRTRAPWRRAAAATALALAACHAGYEPVDPGLRVIGGPLALPEAGGSATFEVALATAPAATVEVDVLAEDATEGLLVGPAGGLPGAWLRLRFAPSDWSVRQSVTVAAVDDALRDGDRAWRVRLAVAGSDDAAYAAAPGAAVQVTTRDDDTPGIRLSRTTLDTAEGGLTDAFEVWLASQPASAVTIPVRSQSSDEGLVSGGPQAIAPTGSVDLVFTPSSWSTPQSVTVTGVPDQVADGDQTYAVTVGPASGDPDYAALAPQQVTVVNSDARPHVVVWPPALSYPEGSNQSFFVRLATAPTSPVFVPIVLGDPAEGRLSSPYAPSGDGTSVTLVFDASSWSTARHVLVSTPTDVTVDGPKRFAVAVGPATGDAQYAALPPTAIDVSVSDVDAPIVRAQSSFLALSEGGSATLWVSLGTAPVADVTVPVVSSDPAEALVSAGGTPPAPSVALTFKPQDWFVDRVVTVSAVDDAAPEAEPPHPFAISVGPGRSASPLYDGVPGPTFTGTVGDDEPEGTLAAPVDVTTLLPWAGHAGTGPSYYRITGFPEGGVVSVTRASNSVSLAVLEDDPVRTTLCASGPSLGVACPVRVPAGGSFLVRVDGDPAWDRTSFTLDAAPFTFGAAPPTAIPDGTYPPLASPVTLSGVPPDYVALAVFVEIAHPRVADLELLLVEPPGNGGYTIARCSYASGADFDRTVLFHAPAFTGLCGASPPWAGIFNPGYLPHNSAAGVNGTWTLYVTDLFPGEPGTLVRWGIAAR